MKCHLCGKPSQIWDGLFEKLWCGEECLTLVLAEVERLEREQFGTTVYDLVRQIEKETGWSSRFITSTKH